MFVSKNYCDDYYFDKRTSITKNKYTVPVYPYIIKTIIEDSRGHKLAGKSIVESNSDYLAKELNNLVIVDEQTFMHYEYIGFNDNIKSDVRNFVLDKIEYGNFFISAHISDKLLSTLPKVEIPWNHYLLNSFIQMHVKELIDISATKRSSYRSCKNRLLTMQRKHCSLRNTTIL